METYTAFPNSLLTPPGVLAEKFLSLGIHSFHDACRYVHELPYGYNSTRDDVFIIFKEGCGSCTTKHGVIATLADEMNIPVNKMIGIYAMTEELVTGTNTIIEKYHLPYLPMVHCFLQYNTHDVDLTIGNLTGKNKPVEEFFFTQKVTAMISEKDEYMLYKRILEYVILKRKEMSGILILDVLRARAEGITLLRNKVHMK